MCCDLAELLKDEKMRNLRAQLYDCEALDIHAGEEIPLMGYRYQVQEHGKWGFISRDPVCITPPIYDGIVASKYLVAAWTYGEAEDQMDLTLSLELPDEKTGEKRIYLPSDMADGLHYPVFEKVPQWLRPEINGMLAIENLDEERIAYLYKPNEEGDLGLLQIYTHGRRKNCYAYYKEDVLAVTEPGGGLGVEIPADGCTMASCLLALKDKLETL